MNAQFLFNLYESNKGKTTKGVIVCTIEQFDPLGLVRSCSTPPAGMQTCEFNFNESILWGNHNQINLVNGLLRKAEELRVIRARRISDLDETEGH